MTSRVTFATYRPLTLLVIWVETPGLQGGGFIVFEYHLFRNPFFTKMKTQQILDAIVDIFAEPRKNLSSKCFILFLGFSCQSAVKVQ